MKRFFPLIAVTMALGVFGAFSRLPQSQVFVSRHENVLGTSLELKFRAANEKQADKAEAAALAEIDRLNLILSAWNSNSEFSRWARTQNVAVPVSPELFEVLGLFDAWKTRSQGALDASAEAFGRLWKKGKLPSQDAMAATLASVRQAHWKLDPIAHTATHLSTTPIALNSFAKSYVVQHAADAALAAGALGAVVNVGGDLVVRGQFEETISVADPRNDAENATPIATLQANGMAVATSGNYRRGVSIDGHHYSHIIDPRTGIPADHVLSSTVIARDAVEAGALATAFSVLSLQESAILARSFPGIQYMIVPASGAIVQSAGWTAVAAQAPTAASPYELTIQMELASIQAQRYRRPFVAIWVEDKDKYPVRTVALWFDKTRWIPELKSWYRGDRMRTLSEGTDITGSVSSATRPPGKYSIKWDGKDNAGKLVKPGKYTVFIEATREHGGYQILRQEIDIPGATAQFTLPGGAELGAVTLEYRKSGR